MKFRETFRFELLYQLRSLPTWIYFAIVSSFTVWSSLTREPADENSYLNPPSALIVVTVFAGVIWLLMAGAVAGHAATRDAQTRMYPLVYTAPVSKIEYLGGRFLAAFILNAMIQLAIPVSFFLSFIVRDIAPGLLAPLRPAAYLTAYFYFSLPLAFVVTACQFSVAVLERKAIVAYITAVLIFPLISWFIGGTLANLAGKWELVKFFDLAGMSTVAEIETWTPFEKNTRLIGLSGAFLWNRLIWLGIAFGFLAYSYFRFQLTHHVEQSGRRRSFRKRKPQRHPATDSEIPQPVTLHVSQARPSMPSEAYGRQAFGFSTHARQIRAIAWSSFATIVKSKTGLTIVGLLALFLIMFASHQSQAFRGVSQYPTAMKLLPLLTAALSDVMTPLIIIPMLIVFYAGELVWREREACLNKIADTVPVSEWVFLLGKFLGLGLVILVWLFFLMMAGILHQVSMGYQPESYRHEVGVYLKALFGFQLTSYLLFALLALVVHVIVNQKYLGHLAMLIVYSYMVFHARLGIEHNLLIYASDPGWSYTDMRGFAQLKPWLWFKLYWTGWAILIAVAARLLWVRSMSQDFKARVQLMRHRFNLATVTTTAIAAALIVISGGYIFYNTNVLNDYTTASGRTARHARYEQHYGKFKNIPQPLLTGTRLHVELYPSQRRAAIRGTYNMVNKTDAPIHSIHIATAWEVETAAVTFDRPSSRVMEDNDLGHQIHVLDKPLQPGDSLTLSFEVHFNAEGFSNNGFDLAVIGNGTYFTNEDRLPVIGYRSDRELRDNGDRKKHRLPPKAFPSLYDTTGHQVMAEQELITFEAVVGTEEGQVAVAPGALLRTWKKNDRSYFQYAASAPIGNTYSFFSADYAMHEATWRDTTAGPGQDIAINLYYHPSHAENIDRIVRSVQASLTYYTKKFSPYPYRHITIVERSGYAGALNAEPATIDYGESFILSKLDDPAVLDVVYFALAHEIAHQWWGAAQLRPAHVEGEPVVSETLANYSALKVLGQTHGDDQVQKLLAMWRDSYEVPRSRFMTPLLQATNPFLFYRKGPLALYTLTRYTDNERVNDALRQLIQKYTPSKPPFPTSLDLYRELKAVTPDSLHYLLRDYFEKNIYWQLKTEQATAKQIDSATWEVTLKVHAKKVIVDSTGAEISIPMDDWVEIGIWEDGENSGKPLYLQKHHIHFTEAGEHMITVTVPGKPARAGIDPYYLLIDLDPDDNTRNVNVIDEGGSIKK